MGGERRTASKERHHGYQARTRTLPSLHTQRVKTVDVESGAHSKKREKSTKSV